MPAIPVWALTLMYWLHMLGAVTWVGSLAAIAFIVMPAANKSLQPIEQMSLLAALHGKVEGLAWFSLGLIAATGLFQMSSNVHYDGFLATSNQWSLAMLSKHILTVIMVAVSAQQTWDVMPAIRRVLLKREKADQQELARLQRHERRLAWTNLILALLIFGATAVARSS